MENCVTELRRAQARWAEAAAVPLLGSFAGKPRLDYTNDYADNLFEPLSAATKAQFDSADGNELTHGGQRPAKMAALHSSSALACNFLHYWSSRNLMGPILEACE